ncbi:inositol monophosphatase family protein [Staphylococcus capitis]|uniref:inositol monophosphatase family protein n=1 Tax=Staphylococcus capitis TaxID=29388 RepID=UPI00345C6155
MTESLKQIDRLICDWLKIVDDILPRLIQEMHTDTKKDRFDLVTNVDKQIQDHFQTFLSNQLPGHLLLAEEKNNDDIDPYHGHVWIMDPIDGTANLVKQQEDYCIILGYFVDGEPKLSYIYDYPHNKLYKAIADEGAYENDLPMLKPATLSIEDAILSFNPHVLNDRTINALFQTSFSYRIIGSCGLDSIRVIKGQFGAHMNTNPKPWDIAAQFLFAQELNLKMTSLDGGKVDFGKGGPFIISNPGCHQDVLDILNSGNGYQK